MKRYRSSYSSAEYDELVREIVTAEPAGKADL